MTEQLCFRGETVDAVIVPLRCHDPRDEPALTAVVDGRADAMVTGHANLADLVPLLPLCG